MSQSRLLQVSHSIRALTQMGPIRSAKARELFQRQFAPRVPRSVTILQRAASIGESPSMSSSVGPSCRELPIPATLFGQMWSAPAIRTHSVAEAYAFEHGSEQSERYREAMI